MKITINKQIFLNKFLYSISKFTDKAVLGLNKDYIDCISHLDEKDSKQTIILYSKTMVNNDEIDKPINLNILSIKKLAYAINCINQDIIQLEINTNNIAYTSEELNFKFHLLEDGILENQTLNVNRLNELTFDFEFVLTNDKLNDIIKASAFINDINKIYLYTKNDVLFCDITDRNISNVDTISLPLGKLVSGNINETTPLKLNIFKILSSLKNDKFIIKIHNKTGIIVFEINEPEYNLKYIVTALIK